MIDAKKVVAASCTSLDQVASYAVSMPHYLSVGANEATSKAVADVLSKAGGGLDLVLDSIEGEPFAFFWAGGGGGGGKERGERTGRGER